MLRFSWSLRVCTFLCLFLLLAGFARAGVLPDAAVFGFGGGETNIVNDVVVDDAGNFYVIGEFTDTVDIDPGPAVLEFSTSRSIQSYLLKLNPAGELLWYHIFEDPGRVYARDLLIDHAGMVLVVGNAFGMVDLEPGPGTTLPPGGDNSGFIMKLDGDGVLQWVKFIGASPIALAVDSNNAVHCTGGYYGRFSDLDPGPRTYRLPGKGTFILRLDDAGTFQWARGLELSWVLVVEGIAVDSVGNVYTVGYFQGGVDFDPGICDTGHESTGFSIDLFIHKLNADGDYQYVQQIGDVGSDHAFGIGVDAQDFVYICGQFAGSVNFGSRDDPHYLTASGASDAFLMKLDRAGRLRWIRALGGPGQDQARGLAIDAQDRVHVTGSFEQMARFGAVPGEGLVTSRGASDVFVSTHTALGTLVDVGSFGGPGIDVGYSVAPAGSTAVYAGGDYEDSLVVGDAPDAMTISAVGVRDGFVVRLPVSDAQAEGEGEGVFEGGIDSMARAGVRFHSADLDGNEEIDLSELLRGIQLYQARGYGCDVASEDGYGAGAPDQSCAPHASDYRPQDWVISLTELLRLIQLYNSGSCAICPPSSPATEDGYCPGVVGCGGQWD